MTETNIHQLGFVKENVRRSRHNKLTCLKNQDVGEKRNLTGRLDE